MTRRWNPVGQKANDTLGTGKWQMRRRDPLRARHHLDKGAEQTHLQLATALHLMMQYRPRYYVRNLNKPGGFQGLMPCLASYSYSMLQHTSLSHLVLGVSTMQDFNAGVRDWRGRRHTKSQ